MHDLVVRWSTDPRWPLGSPSDAGLIVLAVDALTYESAEEFLSADQLVCLTSSFPSTSVVSWLSSVTGVTPREHGVAGPVSIRPGIQGVYNVIRGRTSIFDESGTTDSRTDPPAGSAPGTVFQNLRDRGVTSIVLIGDFLGICEGWIGDLSRGGARRNPPGLLDDIRLDPHAITTLAIQQVDAELDARSRRCVWAYVNLDEYVHYRGYDAVVREVAKLLQQAAVRWSDLGYTVLLYSDHGQTINDCLPADLAAFEALATSRYCRIPAGGAGRVRWLYPHASRETEVLRRLEDVLADTAFVCHSDELSITGLAEEGGLPGAGSVIAVATGARFPVPDARYRYEHGSATADEMLVPLAIWGPR